MLLGIGNAMRRDDGAGSRLAARFRAPGWQAYDGGTAPENFTSVVRRERPDRLVLVDAADMRLPPGSVRRVRPGRIEEAAFDTHRLPLSLLVRYLGDCAGEVILICIQPGQLGDGEDLSTEAAAATERLEKALVEDRIEEIPEM